MVIYWVNVVLNLLLTRLNYVRILLCMIMFMKAHERPNDKIIEDDDCLDGWFIVQRRTIRKR